MLVTTPVLIWLVEKKAAFVANIFRVLAGKKHWVGYATEENGHDHLPPLKDGCVSPATGSAVTDPETLHHLNFLYARDYGVGEDWRIVIRNFRLLGGE